MAKMYESLATKFIKSNPFTTVEEVATTRKNHRDLVKSALDKVKRSVDGGDIKLTVGDIDKLMRLDLLLMGEPDSNSQVTPGIDGIEQQRLIVSCLEELSPDESDFLCKIVAKMVNQRNVLESQKQPPKLASAKTVSVNSAPAKQVPRVPIKNSKVN